jgi:hypothetical protein
MHADIKLFKIHINKSLNKINRSLNIDPRQRIIFKDIIYYCSYMIGNNLSYDITNAHLKLHNILNISKKSLIKNRNNVPFYYFNLLNKHLIDFIYKNTNKRIIAVDGSCIVLLKSLQKENFKVSTNGNYCTALISTLFDIEREIPINYKLAIHKNERSLLLDQLDFLKKNDILVMDRGYYSKKLLFTLHNKEIKVIFRLKCSLKLITKIKSANKNTSIIHKIRFSGQNIKIRIIKYFMEDKEYYLGTTIYNEPISYFKDLYWKRWKIETNFRQSKYDLSMLELKSKTKNTVNQDILIHNFILIIASYFKYLIQKDIDKTLKPNMKNILNITINELLYLLIYKTTIKSTINKIINILNIMKGVTIKIRKNRKYKRIRKRPTSKWCQYGNKFKMAY